MSIFSQLLVPRIATISQVIKEEEEEAKDRPYHFYMVFVIIPVGIYLEIHQCSFM